MYTGWISITEVKSLLCYLILDNSGALFNEYINSPEGWKS